MRLRIVLVGVCVFVATMLLAQDKVSGSVQCAKPDIQQKVDVSDHPGHAVSVAQYKCSWTKPMEVAGVQDKDGIDTGVSDHHGNSGHSHGYYVDNMTNGDKLFVRWEGTDSMKDGVAEGKWSYTGGTGKFKGIKGGGTYKGKFAEDGGFTTDVEGEYSLPK